MEVTDDVLSVVVRWGGEYWDMLLNLEVTAQAVENGVVCTQCPSPRTTFPNLLALYEDHVFQPLTEWLNHELTPATHLHLDHSPLGSTWASLRPHDHPATPTTVCLPIWLR